MREDKQEVVEAGEACARKNGRKNMSVMGLGETGGEGIGVVTRHVIRGPSGGGSGGRGGQSDERGNGMTMA